MKDKIKYNIIIAGGGTGGHLIPAFSIADALKLNPSFKGEVQFVGSKYGLESKLYAKRKEKSHIIDIRGIIRTISLYSTYQNVIVLPLKFIFALIRVFKIFVRFKPHIVIGTGGYSSAIPLLIGFLLGIKIVLQEQNAVLGLVNRIFYKAADIVFFGFTPSYIDKKSNYIVTGNPIINNIKNIDFKAFKNEIKFKDNFTVFILGGSQGSAPINSHFLKKYNDYLKMGIQIVWQCGDKNLEEINKKVQSNNIHLFGFTNSIDKYYRISDLVISRAGALTISELSFYKKASILIPFPLSANNHQVKNAEYYMSKGASEIVFQNELKEGLLENKVKRMYENRDIIKKMEKKSSDIVVGDAASHIVSEILKLNIK
ncbi:MAG: hypothetical protein CMG00_06765 [Candidatus Marinimicrobia bacterium]|nr:hypothetical protein [Candidatus Neomarinimicrobiota bacterium]|tara:strand:+ start:4329 stop:5441 length:1113 start_codon:yes stop_codon:yes gene_type:complete